MISYSWKFRTQIPTQIYDELAKRNYRMWMDRKMGINSNMNRESVNYNLIIDFTYHFQHGSRRRKRLDRNAISVSRL